MPARCNCEHARHALEPAGHVAAAGDRRAWHVGAVCDECAAACLPEFLHARGCTLPHPEGTPCTVSPRVSFAVISGPPA